MRDIVKTCTCCGTHFTIDDLLHHGEVIPIGMVLRPDLEECDYYFNHECPRCRTTFTVPIDAFARFIDEHVPARLLAGTDACESHCLRIRDLEQCEQPCSHAPYRRFLLNVLCRKERGHLPVVYE